MHRDESNLYRFKAFRLDVEDRRLYRNGIPIPLEPKAFDVLTLLVENSGHLVEKDELLQTVWADSFVEESNVARVVYTLRRTLGEDDGKLIETVPKKGYRFVADVEHETGILQVGGENGNRTVEQAGQVASTIEPSFAPDKIPGADGVDHTKKVWRPWIGLALVAVTISILLVAGSFFYLSSPSTTTANTFSKIAVLPLTPISSGNRNELYENGVADSLILKLSSSRSFFVTPLSVTRRYAGVEYDPRAVGKNLNVDYVLVTNYQLAEGKIRITSQLMNVETGLIDETYKGEKDAGRIFAAQDAIATELGNVLFARFGAELPVPGRKRGTANEDAYWSYLQGKNLMDRRSANNSEKAISYFEEAIRLDPAFARAYAGLALGYRTLGSLGGGHPREMLMKANAAALRSLELDPELPEAYVVLGDIKPKFEYDWVGARENLLRAIELDPNNDLAHATYSELLAETGHFDEALAEKDTALSIDPRSLVYQRDRGRILYYSRRYDLAIIQLKRVIELDENFQTAYGWMWLAYAMKGDAASAYEFFIRLMQKTEPGRVETLQNAYKTAGWEGVLKRQLELQKLNEHELSNSYYQMARISSLLGEKEAAFDYLKKTMEKGHSQIVMLKVEPAFDNLRDDPRFSDVLRQIGLD